MKSLQYPGIRLQQVGDSRTKAALSDFDGHLRALYQFVNASISTDHGAGLLRQVAPIVIPEVSNNPTTASTRGKVGQLARHGPDVFIKTGNEGEDTDWDQVPIGSSGFANPTGSIGLTAVNGSEATYMRSDAHPPLSQNIEPIWTAVHRHSTYVEFDEIVTPVAALVSDHVRLYAKDNGSAVASLFLQKDDGSEVDLGNPVVGAVTGSGTGTSFMAWDGVGPSSVARDTFIAEGSPLTANVVYLDNSKLSAVRGYQFPDRNGTFYLYEDFNDLNIANSDPVFEYEATTGVTGGYRAYTSAPGYYFDLIQNGVTGETLCTAHGVGGHWKFVGTSATVVMEVSGDLSASNLALTGGGISSSVASGAAVSAFEFVDTTTTRVLGYMESLSRAGSYTRRVSWDGRAAFGFSSGLVPQLGHRLAFLDDDSTVPAGFPIYCGVLSSVKHSNVTETAPSLVGLCGNAHVSQATLLTATNICGVVGSVSSSYIGTLAGKTLAGVASSLFNANTPTVIETGADIQFNAQSPAGGYDHTTGFWAQHWSMSNSMGYQAAANRPGIISSARVTIQDWGASITSATPEKELWAIYGEHVAGGGVAVYPTVTGFMRAPYPRRTAGSGGTTRAMHIWFEPWPMSAAGAGAAGAVRPNAAEGDVYFDDNTNFTGGLWEFSGTAGGANAWNYLLSSPGVVAAAGGAPAVLGLVTLVGGPVVAAQATWVQINCADNIVRWVPAWV